MLTTLIGLGVLVALSLLKVIFIEVTDHIMYNYRRNLLNVTGVIAVTGVYLVIVLYIAHIIGEGMISKFAKPQEDKTAVQPEKK